MERSLIEKLTHETDEEKKILSGETLDKKIYSAGEEFIVSDTRLHKGVGEISVRTHTRYVPFPEHKHDYVEMLLVLSGELTHRIDGKEVRLREGDVLVMNKHVLHSVDKAGRDDVGVNVIMSDGFSGAMASDLSGTVFSSLIMENGKADGAPMYLLFSTKGVKRLENLVENLLLELTDENAKSGIMARTVALLLICLSADERAYVEGDAPKDKETQRLMEIVAYANGNYRTASLSELSERLYLTVPYLSKIIKERLGKSFKELVMDARFSKAEQLFKSTDLPIGEIIRAVGYENESYFHRAFKARYGTSPLKMRKDNLSNKPEASR